MPGRREIAGNDEEYRQYPPICGSRTPKAAKNQTLAPELPAGKRFFSSLLALVEAFNPSSRIPPKVRFGVEEIVERVILRRTLQPTRRT